MSPRPHPDWARAGRDWPNRDASAFVIAGRVHWHYQRKGQGPALMLLHGAGAATHSWRDLMPLLARSYDVIAPDLPGHGFTRVQSRRQTALPEMAAAVGQLAMALGVAPALIVGHSAGAAIALEAVRTGALAPARVIGLNAALTPFRGLAGAVFPPLAKMLALNPVVPWVFAQMAGSRGQAERLIASTGSRIDADGLGHYARMIARPEHVDGALSMMALWELEPLLAALPQISLPVDLIVAMGDQSVPPDEALRIAAAHPNITAHRVEGLGHLMHEEAPERIAGLITRLAAA